MNIFNIFIPTLSLKVFSLDVMPQFHNARRCICLKCKKFYVHAIAYVICALASPSQNTFKFGVGIKLYHSVWLGENGFLEKLFPW